jgi:hypothetical protein
LLPFNAKLDKSARFFTKKAVLYIFLHTLIDFLSMKKGCFAGIFLFVENNFMEDKGVCYGCEEVFGDFDHRAMAGGGNPDAYDGCQCGPEP